MAGPHKPAKSIGWCPVHQKRMYTDRKRARRVARQHSDHKNAYPCDANEGMWHIGGLPGPVIRGEMSKDEFFNRGGAA